MSFERIGDDRKSLYKNLARVATPIALQSLIGSSLNFVDNLMVGSLGEAELAAVGVGVQLYFIFWMLVYGFSSGCSTFMAQFFGAGDMKNIRKTVGFNISVTLSVGLLFFIAATFFPQYLIRIFTDIPEIVELGAGYLKVGALCFIFVGITVPFTTALRSTQQTKIPLYISVTAFTVNTFLNYVFIFGNFGAPALGVNGAALATVISRLLECSITFIVVFVRKNKIAGRIGEFFGWHRGYVVRVVKNSIPTTVNETLWGLGTAMYVAAYARIGITDYAAVQASNTINSLFIMAAFSVGDATLILVGQKLGEGKTEEAYKMGVRLLRIGTLIGVVGGLLLIITSRFFIHFFNFTPAGEGMALAVLLVYGLTMFLSLYTGIIITGPLRSGGDTRFAMLCECGTVWAIGVPLAFITALFLEWPIYFCVLAVKGEELVKAVILTKRLLSKKWVKNVIHNMDADSACQNRP